MAQWGIWGSYFFLNNNLKTSRHMFLVFYTLPSKAFILSYFKDYVLKTASDSDSDYSKKIYIFFYENWLNEVSEGHILKKNIFKKKIHSLSFKNAFK